MVWQPKNKDRSNRNVIPFALVHLLLIAHIALPYRRLIDLFALIDLPVLVGIALF